MELIYKFDDTHIEILKINLIISCNMSFSSESEKRGRIPGARTNFGYSYDKCRSTFSFTTRQLVERRLITRTQAELTSRLSTHYDQAAKISVPSASKLTTKLSDAIVAVFTSQCQEPLDVPSTFSESVNESLLEAFKRDRLVALQMPLALSVAYRLSELTGRPLIQLDFDLNMSRLPWEEILNLWTPKKD
jgi:hypothetical protein